MNKKRVIGATMIGGVFGAIFVAVAARHGVALTAVIFGSSALLASMIVVGVRLCVEG